MHQLSFIISQNYWPHVTSTLYKPDTALRQTVQLGPEGSVLERVHCTIKLKLYIVVTVFYFFAVMQCSAIFFAMLRCSEPPNAPSKVIGCFSAGKVTLTAGYFPRLPAIIYIPVSQASVSQYVSVGLSFVS